MSSSLRRCMAVSLPLFLVAVSPAVASGAPTWRLAVTPNADYFLSGPAAENDVYTIEAENVGNEPTSGAIKVEDTLPGGFSGADVHLYYSGLGFEVNNDDLANAGLCPSAVECEFPGSLSGSFPSVKSGQKLVMQVRVGVPAQASGQVTDVAKIHGGNAPKALASTSNVVENNPPLGFHGFGAPIIDSSASPYTQAGGHPFEVVTDFQPATKAIPKLADQEWGVEGVSPVYDPKDIAAELPPGLVGNPQGVPRCQLAAFFFSECPISTVVGTAAPNILGEYGNAPRPAPVFNLEPAGSYPGELGYKVIFPFFLIASIRSSTDYGLTLTNTGTPPSALTRTRFTIWGVPAEPAHDALRGKDGCGAVGNFVQSATQIERECETEPGDFGNFHGGPAGVPPTPFLTMPTDCSGESLKFRMNYNVWEVDGIEASAGAEDPAVDGCNVLNFEPQIEARPTTNLADAPSGLDFNLKIPQNEDPEGVATPELKEATIRLPKGLTVNPGSASGLTSCTEAQVGLHVEGPAHCPEASKVGAAEVETPLLHESLTGFLYLASPYQNPAGTLLAGYLVLEGQGVIIKLPGSFETDPQTGQITAKFLENPQLPFEELKLHLFEGSRGTIRTPSLCGSYMTTSTLTPYSAPESGPSATPSASFSTTAAENGGPCPTTASQLPYAPLLRAGTETPQAGIFSPLSLRLVREDGNQEVKGLETVLPPGLVGRLSGLTYCSDAQLTAAAGRTGVEEKASPSCPPSSEVGTADVAAGAGPTPLDVTGRAYLAGPYKGAPISLAIVTPAVAGPFDLGTVVVRAALYVDPFTAQIRAVSDDIPTILHGIPLDIRAVTVKANRPQFTLNPTSCEEFSFTGASAASLGTLAPLSQRFQVGNCNALPFKPKLSLSMSGSTKRAGNPKLKAVLTMKPGEANVAQAQVTLPPGEAVDNAHIGNVCSRIQFAASACPPSSVIGHAQAITPLLEAPLEGPVYLMTGFGHQLPDVAADLNGQIRVLLHGKVDSVHESLRNTFEVVPDAPVSKFTLELDGGKRGLIENFHNLCAAKHQAQAAFTGQNGKRVELASLIKAKCPRHAKKRKAHGRPTGHRRDK
jgi:hypothetical protein